MFIEKNKALSQTVHFHDFEVTSEISEKIKSKNFENILKRSNFYSRKNLKNKNDFHLRENKKFYTLKRPKILLKISNKTSKEFQQEFS